MRVATNALWNAGRSLVGLALGFGTSILVARTLGPAAYGRFTYLVWIVTTLTALLGLGLPMALMKFGTETQLAGGDPALRGLLRACLRRAGLAAAAGGVLLVLGVLAVGGGIRPLEAAIAAATLVPAVLAACCGGAINGLQAYGPTTRVSIAVSVAQFALSVAVVVLGLGVAALLAVNLVGALVSWVWLSRSARAMLGPAARPRAGSAGVPAAVRRYAGSMLVIVLLDAVVWKRSEIFFLARFWDLHAVAYYAVAFGVAEKTMRLPHSLYGILFPTFAGLAAAGGDAAVERLLRAAMRLLALLVVPLGFMVAGLADLLVQNVYGAAYAPAVAPLAAMMVVNLAGALTGVVVMALYGVGDQRLVLTKDGAGAVVNLALNLTATWAWGVWGAVLANSGSQLVASAIVWTRVRRRFHVGALLAPLPRVAAGAALTALLARGIALGVGGRAGLVAGVTVAALAYACAVRFTDALGHRVWRLQGIEAA
jgi:O-antigen/teichoic acid export membrane protein